tara:strand:+ start:28 stop:411 length:384 start_codon:yes stop_codon:yes gene_type:complete
MAGALDTLFKNVAKQVVADLGASLDTSIVYTRKVAGTYNVAKGSLNSVDTTYSIKVPVEFINSVETSGFQENTARLYITPDLIGDKQPLLQDEVTITFSGSTRVAKITNIQTLKGGQEYLFRIDIVF